MKPLSGKERFDSFAREHVCSRKDIKKSIKEAEDFVISMKRDDDKVWNMRLNLIIEEFRNKIFGSFEKC